MNKGLMTQRTCAECGMTMRACNLARHQRYRHDPTYVRPSRTKDYRRTHRGTYYRKMERLHQQEVEWAKQRTLYIVHLSRPDGLGRLHYMGSTDDLRARLRLHAAGNGSAMLAWCKAEGITFALTWAAAGSRNDERYIKQNRRLAELCTQCRPTALAKRAAKARVWRRTRKGSVTDASASNA